MIPMNDDALLADAPDPADPVGPAPVQDPAQVEDAALADPVDLSDDELIASARQQGASRRQQDASREEASRTDFTDTELIESARREGARRDGPIDPRTKGFKHITTAEWNAYGNMAMEEPGLGAAWDKFEPIGRDGPITNYAYSLGDTLQMFQDSSAFAAGEADIEAERRIAQRMALAAQEPTRANRYFGYGKGMYTLGSEFLLTGGANVVGKGAFKLGMRKFRGDVIDAMLETGEKRALAAFAKRTEGTLAGRALKGAAFTAEVTAVQGVIGKAFDANTARRVYGREDWTDEEAKLWAALSNEGMLEKIESKSPLWSGMIEQLITNTAEQMGGTLTRIPGISYLAALESRGLRRLAQGKVLGEGTEDAVGALLKKSKVAEGGVAEFAEEIVGGMAVEGLYGDSFIDALPASVEEAALMMAAFATPGLTLATLRRMSGKRRMALPSRQAAAQALQDRGGPAVGQEVQVGTSSGVVQEVDVDGQVVVDFGKGNRSLIPGSVFVEMNQEATAPGGKGSEEGGTAKQLPGIPEYNLVSIYDLDKGGPQGNIEYAAGSRDAVLSGNTEIGGEVRVGSAIGRVTGHTEDGMARVEFANGNAAFYPKGAFVSPKAAVGEKATGAAKPTEGGDASESGAEDADAAPTAPDVSPEELAEIRAADVQTYRDKVKEATGIEAELEEAEPVTRDERYQQSFLRRRGIEPIFVRAEDSTGMPRGFFPGPGRAVVLLDQGGYAGIHESYHAWEDQQSQQRIAALDTELRGIDQEFMRKAYEFAAENSPLKDPSPALLREEGKAIAAERLGPILQYIETKKGAEDFAELYKANPGRLGRTWDAIRDWLASLIPKLPPSKRKQAEERLGELSEQVLAPETGALLAKAYLNALDEIKPVRFAAPTAAESAEMEAAVPPVVPKQETPAGEDSGKPKAEKREATRRVKQRLGDGDSTTPQVGDLVTYFDPRKNKLGGRSEVTAEVLEATGSGKNVRLRIRIAANGPQSRGERAAAERLVNLDEVELFEEREIDDLGSRREKNRARAAREEEAGAEPRFASAKDVDISQNTVPLSFSQKIAKGENPITIAVEEWKENLRLILQRAKHVGQQKNARTRVNLKAGSLAKFIMVGRITPNDWLKLHSTTLTEAEFKTARRWYKDAHTFFNEAGADAGPLLIGWLVANKNVSVTGATLNMLRSREHLLSALPVDFSLENPKSGLSETTLTAYWEWIESGMEGASPAEIEVGRKLVDFVDSALGKTTRTWMGDDARGGEPFVSDVHTNRDMGYIDEVHETWLLDNAADPKQVAALERDVKAGVPHETQYEYSSRQGAAISKHLNKIGYDGGGWTPSQVQAVGWMGMQKLTGKAMGHVRLTLPEFTHQVSAAATFSTTSPLGKKYGDAMSALPMNEQIKLTDELVGIATEVAQQLAGDLPIFNRTVGIGKGAGWDAEPAVNFRLAASHEGLRTFSQVLGYLLQQDSILTERPTGYTKSGAFINGTSGTAVDLQGKELLDRDTQERFWDALSAESDFFGGFHPTPTGIRFTTDVTGEPGKGSGALRKHTAELDKFMASGAIDRALDAAGVTGDVDSSYILVEALFQGYSHKESYSDGKPYLEGLSTRFGPAMDPILRDGRRRIAAHAESKLGGSEARFAPAAGGNQADARGLRNGGRVRGVIRLLDEPHGSSPGADAPLRGLPTEVKVGKTTVTAGPLLRARRAAEMYAKRAGLDYNPPRVYVALDKERGKRIADAFEVMAHAPDDPEVRAAFEALAKETVAQWQAIKETGLVVEFNQDGDPYGNPRNAIRDVRENNHLFIFPTEEGYGTEGDESANGEDNPMLRPVEGEFFGGRPVLVNDIFRAVHDYFGHVKEGVGFRARGEENAWAQHMPMYSPLAQRALSTETRGQNSWVNFGPHGEFNATANGGDTVYAAQKVGLLPLELTQLDEESRFAGAVDPSQGRPKITGSFLEDAELVSPWYKFQRGISDEFVGLKRYVDVAKKAGADLTANPTSAVRRYFGKISERADEIDKQFSQPILELMKAQSITLDDAGEYVYARHVPEANEKFHQDHLTRSALAAERREIKASMRGLPRNQQVENDLRALDKRIADLDYVPIRVPDGVTAREYFHELDPRSGMATSEARATQSKMEAKPGYLELGKKVDAMNRRTRDRMLEDQLLTPEEYEAWANQYKHYVPLRTAEVDKPEGPRSAGLSVRGRESKKRKGRKSKADNPLVMSFTQALNGAQRGEKNAVGLELRGFLLKNKDLLDSSERPIERDALGRPMLTDYEFHLKVEGKDTALTLQNKDVVDALKRVGLPSIPSALRYLSAGMRIWRAMVTSASPTFVVSNLIRDIQTALINVQSVSDEFDLEGMRWQMIRTFKVAGKTAYQHARGQTVTTGMGARYAEYRQNGGQIGTFSSPNFEEQSRLIEKELQRGDPVEGAAAVRRKVADLGRGGWHWIEDVNQAVETATRFAFYNALRDRGVSAKDSAFASRQLTVDFSQKGTWGSGISLLYAFFSAGVGGIRRAVEEFSRSSKSKKLFAGLVIQGFVQDQINEMWSADDDDGLSFYSKISEGDKKRYIHFMLPGAQEPLKILMPYSYALAPNIGRLASEWLAGGKTKGDVAGSMLNVIADNFNPMGSAPSIAQFMAPTLLDPIVQIQENKNFAGTPIRPGESPFGPERAAWSRSSRKASDTSIQIAEVLNWMTGGDEVRPGALNLAGDDVEHIGKFLGGGVGRTIGDFVKLGMNAANGEISAEAVPFINLLYGAKTEHGDRANFYEARKEVEYQKADVKAAHDTRDFAREVDLKRRYAHTLQMDKRLKAASKRAAELKDRAYAANKFNPDKELLDKADAELRRAHKQYALAVGRNVQSSK
jgi:hypothetical protein